MSLQNIHKTWKERLHTEKSGYVVDGVLNHELYKSSMPKICFLCKEANYRGIDMVDSTLWYSEGGFGQFSSRLQEWAHGILEGFPAIQRITYDQKRISLLKTAIVNVKKTGGLGVADDEVIAEHALAHGDLLRLQLHEIKPNIIILGVSTQRTRSALFPEVVWAQSGYYCDIANWNGIKLIDFYHPSSRNAPAASYSLLQNIIGSEVFRNL